jgi:hypothetical protein
LLLKKAQHGLDSQERKQTISQWNQEKFVSDGLLSDGNRGASRNETVEVERHEVLLENESDPL